MPPARSGVASCSADLVPALNRQHDVDVFVDDPLVGAAAARAPRTSSSGVTARDVPYDLTVYQLGNSSCHDYLLALPVPVPRARRAARRPPAPRTGGIAAAVRGRVADYRAEFTWNQPTTASPISPKWRSPASTRRYYTAADGAPLARASRMVAVQTRMAATIIRGENPEARGGHPAGTRRALTEDEASRLAPARRARAAFDSAGRAFSMLRRPDCGKARAADSEGVRRDADRRAVGAPPRRGLAGCRRPRRRASGDTAWTRASCAGATWSPTRR